ncbi:MULTISPECIES: alpha/beta hydrolase [Streptomyces]|uniref:alpha/beta hydrolase n=1 Tax=Streptomyces TaxID=1883 RepID=UPI0001D06E9C|nr:MULTISPECIES: alpha/beta hydrolase [Streptomyces]EFF89138.1 dienelactone hydrolase domain-containing protein [Streptomyces sp. e14]MBY8870049.1 alpha/beta hydrolase [Streptomyces sennicomposti]NED37140.1 alpha/beta hydrolase [Streptomyces sp. SID8499]NED71000.1 alpha/beta hydrolase [Streptomyces sp. SID9944]
MKANVTFPSAGLSLAGILYTPDSHTGAPLPAVVVSHPGGGVKEQTASIYAERLAREGYAALVFDAAYQGESEGTPRGLENPFQRAEDVRAAVTYLTTRDDIDPARIGALGICASGGYVPFAAQTDHRIKAVATVSAVDINSLLVDGLGRTQGPEVLQGLLDQAGALRTAEAKGETPAVLNWAPESPEGLEEAPTLYREAQDYYRTPRGGHCNSNNEWPLRSIDHIAQFQPYALIKLISPRPLLMIVGSDSDTAYFSREAIEQANEPKELFVVDGATHVSLYDKDEHVTPAVAKLTDFFGQHLAG